jgi:cell division inhibitor SepF
MSGFMRKTGLWLGLVEDDDRYGDRYDARYDDVEDDAAGSWDEGAGARRYTASRATATATRGSSALDLAPRPHAVPDPHGGAAVSDGYRITTLHPRTYNEARTIGEHFREGTPVIMNLTEMDDVDAKRLVDFAAGLIFGLHGSIERVTNKVFLLSPEHVEVTAEDKARIVEGGFFNQS